MAVSTRNTSGPIYPAPVSSAANLNNLINNLLVATAQGNTIQKIHFQQLLDIYNCWKGHHHTYDDYLWSAYGNLSPYPTTITYGRQTGTPEKP